MIRYNILYCFYRYLLYLFSRTTYNWRSVRTSCRLHEYSLPHSIFHLHFSFVLSFSFIWIAVSFDFYLKSLFLFFSNSGAAHKAGVRALSGRQHDVVQLVGPECPAGRAALLDARPARSSRPRPRRAARAAVHSTSGRARGSLRQTTRCGMHKTYCMWNSRQMVQLADHQLVATYSYALLLYFYFVSSFYIFFQINDLDAVDDGPSDSQKQSQPK